MGMPIQSARGFSMANAILYFSAFHRRHPRWAELVIVPAVKDKRGRSMLAEAFALYFNILCSWRNRIKICIVSRSPKRLGYADQRFFRNIPPAFFQARKNCGK